MVVDDTIAQALNRIADGQEEINNTLNRIASHYDGKPQNVSNAMEIWACRSEPQMVFAPAIGIDYDYNPLNAYH